MASEFSTDMIQPPQPSDFDGASIVDFDDFVEQLDEQRGIRGEVHSLVTSSAVGLRMADIAESQRGVSESGGEDRGVPYQRYVKPFGSGLPPLPWCAFFVSWSYWQTTGKRPLWSNPGYVPSVHEWASRNGRLTSAPQRGDMFGISGTHMGLVAARLRQGQILSIEGNWGDAVVSVRRPITGLWFATP